MSRPTRTRMYEQLTAPDVPARLGRQSVLCLPIGSVEQHGPHLPLNTAPSSPNGSSSSSSSATANSTTCGFYPLCPTACRLSTPGRLAPFPWTLPRSAACSTPSSAST